MFSHWADFPSKSKVFHDNIAFLFWVIWAIIPDKPWIMDDSNKSNIFFSIYPLFKTNLVSLKWFCEKNIENQGKQDSWFSWKFFAWGKHQLLLQIYAIDKLLDQNGWNFDTKNVKVYSLRLDQFQMHDCYHFLVKA